MPERSSPGEAAARPEADDASGPQAGARPSPDAPAPVAPAGPAPLFVPASVADVPAGTAQAAGTRPGDGDPTWFAAWDDDSTRALPHQAAPRPAPGQVTHVPDSAPDGGPGPATPPSVGSEAPTQDFGPHGDGGSPGGPPDVPVAGSGDGGGRRRGGRRALLVVAAVVGLLALLYVGDLALSSGTVPRGVAVAGQAVGGLTRGEAEQRLRDAIEPRTTRPVTVTVGDVRAEIDPRAAGLAVDWDATLDRAGSQPLNPVTRVRSFFTTREVGVATAADERAVTTALEQLGPVVDRPPAEGGVRFEGTTPVGVPPVSGQRLDVPAAREALERGWAGTGPVALPVVELPASTSDDDVTRAVDEVARPAVSAPVSVLGEEDVRAEIGPDVIASALTFRPEPGQGLVPELNRPVIQEALEPQLESTEQKGRDATLDFSSGRPVVVASQDGRGVDYEATLKDLLEVLTGTGAREITAVYAEQPAELTTDELNGMGITGVIGEFSTSGFAADSGLNIKRAAQQINGMIVEPGETFSLNGATSPRNAANGYVEAGIISDGHASRGIGGGVSQLATTLYNAAYFAGMVDVTHKEHSFYISRYPAGREATVFEGAIDMRFRNDNPTGVLIQTKWTPSTVTVTLYGTKRYEVTSSTGPRTNPTQPETVTIPPGEPCISSQGAPGFTITDTRTIREIATGEVRTQKRTVKYNPVPIVVCG